MRAESQFEAHQTYYGPPLFEPSCDKPKPTWSCDNPSMDKEGLFESLGGSGTQLGAHHSEDDIPLKQLFRGSRGKPGTIPLAITTPHLAPPSQPEIDFSVPTVDPLIVVYSHASTLAPPPSSDGVKRLITTWRPT